MRSWHWRAIFNEMFMDCLLAMVFRKFGSPEKDIYDDAVLLGVPFGRVRPEGLPAVIPAVIPAGITAETYR